MPPDSDLAIQPAEGHIVASRILDSGVQILGTGNTLRNSEIAQSAGDGVLVRGNGNTVTNNYIHDVGWMGSYTPGIEINGNGHTVTHNTIRRTGRAAIDTAYQINGTEYHDNRIAYNDISEAMRTSRDGSPFYVCCYLNGTGSSIDHNTAHDSRRPERLLRRQLLRPLPAAPQRRLEHRRPGRLLQRPHRPQHRQRGPQLQLRRGHRYRLVRPRRRDGRLRLVLQQHHRTQAGHRDADRQPAARRPLQPDQRPTPATRTPSTASCG